MKSEIRQIIQTIEKQNEWRGSQTLNLIASENAMSDDVKFALQSDFTNRYAEGHPGSRYYQGTKYADQLESYAEEELKKLTGAKYIEVRCVSGTHANDIVFSSLLGPNDIALVYKVSTGGHISHQLFGAVGKYTRNIINIPTLDDGYFIDAETCKNVIAKYKPRVIVLGRSLILFPEQVSELASIAESAGSTIVYDASHVFGLVLAGIFNKPLAEGAHIMTASTHKTFFGTQRGIIATNSQNIYKKIDKACFPGSVSNHHLNTLAGLAIAIAEFKEHGEAYARQVVSNAKRLAAELDKAGLNVLFKDKGFTQTHQLVIDTSKFGCAAEIATRLEQNNIIVNANMLPNDKNIKTQNGIRMGVQELTRYGMKEKEMEVVAGFVSAVISGGKDVSKEVTKFRSGFTEVMYTSNERKQSARLQCSTA